MSRRRGGSSTEGSGSGGAGGGSVGAPTITITSQTQNATVLEPDAGTFTVAAISLSSITYQWQKATPGSTSELSFANISGATSSSYTTPATNAQSEPISFYRCVLTSGTESVTSGYATLTVVRSPQITTQPVGVTVAEPATATFTVVAAGSGTLTYQWQRDGVDIGGATSASYTTGATEDTADNGAQFRCVVSNTYASATSNIAVLTVTAVVAPTVTIQPSNTTVAEGATASFSISATGTATLSYQWYKSGVLIAGATNSSYTTPATVAATYNGATYYCIVTNAAGSAQSNSATLTVTVVNPADTTGPTVSVAQSHSSPLTTDNFYLTATVSDASGIASIIVAIDGSTAASGSTSPLSSPPTQYSAGDHSYTVTAVDASAGSNTTISSGTFTVNAIPTGGGGLLLPITLSPSASTTLGVDGGIVFPRAALTNVADPLGYSLGVPTALRLEKDSVEIPASYRTLSLWPDGSVKSVLVSALRGNTTTNYNLFYGTGCTRSQYSTGLTVVSDSTRITVNTGTIQMLLSKSAGYLFEQLVVGGSNLLSAGADMIVRDNFDLSLYKSSNCINPTYTIEEQTPVKVIIKHTGKLRSAASGGGGGSVTSVSKLGNQYSALSSGWTVSGTDIYANIPSYAEYSVDCGSGGTTVVSVTAINNVNTAAPGLPGGFNFQVNVYVDSVFKTTINVPGSGSAYQTASASIAGITAGTHTFRLDWINDAWLDGSYDANIRIASSSYVTNSAGGSVAGDSVDYILRYTLYGGSDLIEVQGTVVDTVDEANKAVEPTYLTTGADTNMARSLSAWYFQIPYTLSGTQTYTYGTTGQASVSGTVTSEHYILQTWNDNLLNGVSGANNFLLERETGTVGTDLTGQGSGWGDVSNSSRGITMLIKDFWYKAPHGLRVQSNTAYVDLHPQRASDKPVLADANGDRFQRPRTLYFARHGDAYTEEVLFSFHSGAHRGLALNNSWQDKPYFTAPLQWMCDSKAFGNMIPSGSDSIGHDDWMDKCMNRYITSREALGGEVSGYGDEEIMYGKRDHGCSMYFGSNPGKGSSGQRKWKVNLNSTHIDKGRFYHTHWVRTGNSIYRVAGRRLTRHFMDHDVSHCNRLGQVNYPANLGPGEPHNRFHNDGQFDHSASEMNDNHCVIGGLPQYYLLYGDLRALDVMKEVGGFLTATINTNMRFQLPFSSKHPSISGSYEHRDWAWSVWGLLEISRVVDSSAYRAALGRAGTFLQQWFRQTGYGHVQAGATVHANDPSTGRGAWLLPGNSANNSNATTWNGGSCWMHFGLIAVGIQMFEEGKDYSAIWGGYTAAQWMDMLLQNIEFVVRHSYKPTVGHTYSSFSTNDRRKNGSYWLYDESRIIEFSNEYGKLGNDGGGAPTTFVNAQVLGGGGSYALAWAYDKLTNGDSVAGTYANPSWITTQSGSTKYIQQLTYDAYIELKTVRSFTYVDNVRVYSNGWYGYEWVFLADFFTIARNVPAVTSGGTSAPNINFSSSVGTTPVTPGTSVTLSWTVSNATSLTATGGSGSGGTPTGSAVMVLGDTLISQPNTANLFANRLPPGSSVVAGSLLNVRDAIDDYVTPLTTVPATVYVCLGLYNNSNNSQIAYVTELVALLKSKGATTVYWQNCTAVSGNAAATDFYDNNYVTWNSQLSGRQAADGFTMVDYKTQFLGQTARFNGDLITHTTPGQQALVDLIVSTLNIQTTSSWVGSKSLPTGSEVVNPTATTTYSLTATGAGGTTGPISVTVTVNPGGGGWVEVWREDFNGPAGPVLSVFDATQLSRFGVFGNNANGYDPDYTGNNEGGSTCFRPGNCTLDGNSNLVITMKRESFGGFSYTSGNLYTRHRFFRKYGRITWRLKCTATAGMFPAGWMQGEAWLNTGPQTQNWTGTGEFDVFEWKGEMSPTLVNQNFINCNSGTSYGDSGWGQSTIPAGGRVDAFHEYTLEWLHDGVKMYIDGQLMKQNTRGQAFSWEHAIDSISDGVHYVGTTYDLPFFLYCSLQGRTGQGSGTFPATFTIDWIRWEDPA